MELLRMTSSPTPSVKRKLSRNSNFVLEGGVLYYQGKGKFQRVLFTPEKKREAFEEAHVVSAERHHGIRATGINITKSYYWPRITLHARQWVKECKKCQRDKLAKQEAQSARVRAKKCKGVAPAARLRERPSVSPPLRLPPPAAVAPKKEALTAQVRRFPLSPARGHWCPSHVYRTGPGRGFWEWSMASEGWEEGRQGSELVGSVWKRGARSGALRVGTARSGGQAVPSGRAGC
ncbi:uncharacterized protein LOC127539756 isoform X2 [Antechinus flavipes]|uniref:uncharacterized protein LOC127539756 isoform X2 n=1 Tax=Antechinus flavipes TaxID=38775 RepID=UPI0022364B67|nr:uncharacterized protein LOC127539756 isoform X2 [Antechinus flavipes]